MARAVAPSEVIALDPYERAGYPHDAFARLRARAPVAWCEAPGFPAFWAVTKHEDIIRLSKDPAHFVNAPMMAVFPREQYEAERFPFRHLINMDPPEHRAYRSILSAVFTPRALEPKRARVLALVDQLVRGLRGRSELDFVAELAAIVPLAVIAEMLGIPEADWKSFFHWTNQIIAGTDPDYQEGTSTQTATDSSRTALFQYFQDMVAERRRAPRDDLTSLIANAKVDGADLPEWELLSYLALVVVAGNETTRNAATGGMLALIENPGELARLRRDPTLLYGAVEEILRWTSPVVQMARTAVRDVELRGQQVRAGEQLCLFYASANRDEDVFPEPFEFRIERRPNRHLAFGIGEHVCLGAHLARMELQALFARLVPALEGAELTAPPARQRSSFVGGYKRLAIRWRLAA